MRVPIGIRRSCLLIFGVLPLWAQAGPDLKQIVDRIERLEQENRALKDELRALKERLEPAGVTAPPTVPERLEIAERRIEEQAQSKVESSQRVPLRVTGMALVNTYINSRQNGGNDNPTLAFNSRGNATGGATWRQTMIGLDYHGPQTAGGGQLRGAVMFDFFAGQNLPLNNQLRLRTASIGVDWKTRTLQAGQDKPIISPRDPTSLAQVGASPLTGAGNLWLWVPQVRFEQRWEPSPESTVRAQFGVIQTSESSANVPAAFAGSLERFRPGYEGRVEFGRRFGETHIEIAPGYHLSDTHVAGTSVPSRVFSMDWLIGKPERLELTGSFFTGRNVAHFGTGGIRQGFIVRGIRDAVPVHSTGGWSQLTVGLTERLSLHLMAGQHDDRNRDVAAGGIGRNLAYGGNFFYRFAPNMILSLEYLQLRTSYLGIGNRLNNHYDLGVAYLF